MIETVKGTREFYPETMAVRMWLYEKMRRVSRTFGYQEYDGPFLEPLELYAAKSGDELVREQAFVFKDRGDNWITLRPELTPSLARMVAQKQRELTFPLRWWSFGPMWRYERPQKGRSREFFQWNVDLIGAESPEADAELVAVAAAFLRESGLSPKEVVILVNNRRLVDAQFEKLDITIENRPSALRLIDRREKMSLEKWRAYAAETVGLSAEQTAGIEAMMQNEDLWQESDEMQRFFAAANALGVGEYLRFAPYIARGLDYYTGTVFEARDPNGEFRAILGGGRYDNLVAAVGGEPLSGVGFAMGDMVISLVLEKFGHLPDPQRLLVSPVLVTVFEESLLLESLRLSSELRAAGLNVVCYEQATKLQKQLKYAERIGARVVVLLGPDELANGKVAIKNLAERTQILVGRETAAASIEKILVSAAGS
ncbi:MAG: histidine--tRNA ligase [Anaerolineales bacterium]